MLNRQIDKQSGCMDVRKEGKIDRQIKGGCMEERKVSWIDRQIDRGVAWMEKGR